LYNFVSILSLLLSLLYVVNKDFQNIHCL